MTALNPKDAHKDNAAQISGDETTGGIAWFRQWMMGVSLQAPLLTGTAGCSLALVLTPGRLRYVCKRLEHFEEMERLRERAPVEYFRAYASDLGDSRQMQELHSILVKLQMLRVCVSKRRLDRAKISVSAFRSLTSLELHWCGVSANSPVGLQALRGTLQRLVCVGSVPSLKSILAGADTSVQEADPWPCLRHLACVKSGLQFMDSSLALLPAVSLLNLSRARISSAENLQACAALTCLDLSFNVIASTAGIHRVVACVTCLVLRCNNVRRTTGLEHLLTLRSLDLAGNLLSDMKEVARIATLPCLSALWLEGNPLSFQSNNYRAEVLSLFKDPGGVRLDGHYATNRTVATAHRIARTNYFEPIATDSKPEQVPIEAGFWETEFVRCASPFRDGDRGTVDTGASTDHPRVAHGESAPAVQSSAQHETVQSVAHTPQAAHEERDQPGHAPSAGEPSASFCKPERKRRPSSEAPLHDSLSPTASADDLHGVNRELSRSPTQPSSVEAGLQSSQAIKEHQSEADEDGPANDATNRATGLASMQMEVEEPVRLSRASSDITMQGFCSPQASVRNQDASTGGDKHSGLATTPSWTWWGLTELKRRVLELVPKKDLPQYARSVFDSVPVQDLTQGLGSEDDKSSCDSEDDDASVSSASHYSEDLDARSYDKPNRSLSFLEIAAAPSLGILGIPGILPPPSSRGNIAGTTSQAAARTPEGDARPSAMGAGDNNNNNNNSNDSNRDDSSGARSRSQAPRIQGGGATLPAGADATVSGQVRSGVSPDQQVSQLERDAESHPASTRRYQERIRDALACCPAPRLSYRSVPPRHLDNQNWFQQMFRLRVKPRGSTETGLACFRCDYVRVPCTEDSSAWDAVDALVLFSEVCMYICRLDSFLVLHASSLSKLPTFWVGGDHQIVFLDDQQVEIHLLLRDGQLVQALVAHLLDACTSCCPGKHVCVASLERLQYESIQAQCCDQEPGLQRHGSGRSAQTLLMYVMVQWLTCDANVEANSSGTSAGNSTRGESQTRHSSSGVSTSSCESNKSTTSSKWSSRTCVLVLTRTQILLLDIVLPNMLGIDKYNKSDNMCYTILERAQIRRLVHVQCVQKYAIYSEETLPAACPDRVMMTGESTYACPDGSANTGIYNWAPSVRLTLVFEDDFESGQKAEHPSVNKARDECMPSTGRDALPDGVCRWEMEISEAEATKLCTLLRAL